MDKNYPLASPTWDEAELAAIRNVVSSGQFTMGERVAEFEADFARYVGSRYCVMVNSGSSANLLMAAALSYQEGSRVKRGDEVIVPAVSWSTTYFPFHQYGLKLKIVDVDSETLNYDLDALEEAITDRTRIVVAVNLLGNPNDFERIKKLVSSRDIILLEDNCESLGGRFGSKMSGTFGLMGTFSTFFSHHISTMEGGMVATDDEELYHILICLRAHGWTRNLPKKNRVCGEKSDDPFYESFRFVLPGYNLRPTELNAAIGLEQLKKLPGFIRTRRENAEQFKSVLGDHRHFQIQKEIGQSSWFGFSLVIKPGAPIGRAQVVRAMAEKGIECRPIVAGNFARSESCKWMDTEVFGELKNADRVHEFGLFVGNHHYRLDAEIRLLADTLNGLS
ncbi:MAG TPA: DegT/DnrJ/EryC1/StrS family aminotransferase, partial [Candidatus Polarisedimenticolia bacterium]|nr:DegT/DnrJ/EryC1/StrS family aminotransferase [Candidatus Polarisedimenticolia bacterium]